VQKGLRSRPPVAKLDGVTDRRRSERETLEAGAAAPDPPSAFDAGWREAERYLPVSELAGGGDGHIAVAVDRKLGRRVVLKRPAARADDLGLEREARVLARLEHPSIVPIHDAGRDRDGTPFYAMKLVDGETLEARIARATRFDERLALLAIVTAVSEAMAYAHAQGVIHRDLKPASIVVGAFGEAVIIDWGQARVIDEPGEGDPDAPGDGLARDAAGYLAPEQAAGQPVDRRTDVHALGALLYHVLSGVPPLGPATGEAASGAVLGAPIAVDVREPRVPRELAAIVRKAMARAPDQRYPSAVELAEDLRRYRDGRLVAAHRYRPWTRVWRSARRHPGRVALTLGALAVAAASWALVSADRAAPALLCSEVDAEVRAIWNPEVAARLERAFAASGAGQALASGRAVVAALTARTDRIAALRRSACRATRITREQSPDALDLQLTCLGRRTSELRSFVTWVTGAARSTVERAADSLSSLSRVEDCADLGHLRDLMPLPSDPVQRAAIARVDSELDAAMTLARAGQSVQADRLLPALVERAQATGYDPLRARALYCRAQLLRLQTRPAELAALIADGLVAAERAGSHRLRADLLTLRLDSEFNVLDHLDGAITIAEQVRAIGERLHDPELVSTALGYLAQIEARLQHLDVAVRDAEQAVAVLPEPESRKGWAAQGRLGNVYLSADRPADAKRVLVQLIASRRAVLGNADDPHFAGDLVNLAAAYDNLDDVPHAYEALSEAVAMFDRTLPVDADARLEAHTDYAVLQGALGHWDEARRNLEAQLPVSEAKRGHDSSGTAHIVYRLAEANAALHRYTDALAGYRDAGERSLAAREPLQAVRSQRHVGTLLVALDRLSDARSALEAALQGAVRLRGADSVEAALCRGELARALIALGDARGAIRELDTALAVLDRGAEPGDRGRYRLALAKAHQRLGDTAHALDQARQARALLLKAGADGADDLAELEHWERAAHPRGGEPPAR